MNSSRPVGGIILAAGRSQRFGADKRTRLLPGGKGLLESTIENAASCITPLIVTLRNDDEAFRDSLAQHINHPNILFLLAKESAKGMGRSLANSVAAISDWRAAFIMLGDMPYIQPTTLKRILAAYESSAKGIIVPVNGISEGHPVLFDEGYFAALRMLEGDHGGRSVIRKHADDVLYLKVDDPGIVQDIDTPEDLN